MLSNNFVGEISADARGWAATQGPGAGIPSTPYNGGSGGGSHGGRGGRADKILLSSNAYGTIYYPETYGSGGGNGGRGGGTLILDVTEMFRLEGRIHSNGQGASGGGGAGGSIIVRTLDFDGEGSLEVNGGTGEGSSGGGGGGRIAVYYTGNSTYIGSYQAFGGSSSAEKGGCGTVYIEDRKNLSNPHRTLRFNNGLSRTGRLSVEEIRELILTGNSLHPTTVPTYQSPSGVILSTTDTPRRDVQINRNWYYDLRNLGNLLTSTSSYYTSLVGSVVITYQFPTSLFLHHLLIYPTCKSNYMTNHFIRVFLQNNVVEQSRTSVDTSYCLRGQPERMNVKRTVDKVGFLGLLSLAKRGSMGQEILKIFTPISFLVV